MSDGSISIGGMFFLDQDDVKILLVENFGDSVKGDRIKTIEIAQIEKALENDPYVQHAVTWMAANGIFHIKIVQKKPLARVINKYGVHYYIDENILLCLFVQLLKT